MKAYYCASYGPPEVLELRDLPKPQPNAHQILVKVQAVPATVGDCRIRAFRVPPSFRFMAKIALGFTRPRKPVLGRYFAGVVDAIGKTVTRFNIGDRVFGSIGNTFGTYAEYVCVSEKACVTTIPESMSFEQAAASLWGNGTALHFLRHADIHTGQQILINGASGSVGLGAIQLAKYFGCIVTAVCSAKNRALVESVGADYVIDYTQEDFTENGVTYDIVFDAVGNHPVQKLMNALKTNGLLLHVVAAPDVAKDIRKQIKGTQKRFVGGTFTWNKEMLAFIKQRIEHHEIQPIIDRIYAFEDMIKAHYRVDSGRKTGDVIVTLTTGIRQGEYHHDE